MKYIHLNKVTSTNDYLKDNINTLPKRVIITTDEQTNGRGRIGHTWCSETSKNIIISYLYKQINITDISLITLSIACAVRKFLLNYLPKINQNNLKIKWPNDIYYFDKKLCGILCENVITNTNNIIIGIGININQMDFNELNYKVTSLKQINNIDYNLIKLNKKLSRYINHEINKFIISNNHLYIINYINDHLYGQNKLVEYTINNQKQQGILSKLDTNKQYLGQVIINTNNELIRIISNEIIFIEK